jgi:hypothetical protein
MTRSFTYLFSAHAIQRFIFRSSGRLRDAIGASDLLARLTSYPRHAGEAADDLVAAVAERCGVLDDAFSRRGGAAFCVSFTRAEDRDKFQALWRLTVAAALPGLEFSDATGDDTDENKAIEAAYKELSAIHENSAASVLPLGGPATKFVPRTGRPEIAIDRARRRQWRLNRPDDLHLDQSLLRIRRRGKLAIMPRLQNNGGRMCLVLEHYDELARRVLPEGFTSDPSKPADGGSPLLLPRNLTDDEGDTFRNPMFPFDGERNLAVVHADLSALGRIYREQAKGPPEVRRAVSQNIEAVVLGAVQAAVNALIRSGGAPERIFPVGNAEDDEEEGIASAGGPGAGTVTARVAAFRPLIAGGDDVTFLVRSDLALGFAKTLLESVEAKALEVEKVSGLKLPLSACAGIALVKASTPFLFAHQLADALCVNAKKASKELKRQRDGESGNPPFASALAFHAPVGTLGESYEAVILKKELTANDIMLTGGPYGVGGPSDGGAAVRPSLDWLIKLVEALDAQKGLGALRELRAILFDRGRRAAEEAWRRWWQVQKDRNAKLDGLAAALQQLGVERPETTFLAPMPPKNPHQPRTPHEPAWRTALFDALALRTLHRGTPDETRPSVTASAKEPVQ